MLTPRPASAFLSALLLSASCTDAGADADRLIADGGVIAPGWSARLDEPDADPDQVRFVEVDGGYDASNGPNTVFWSPTRTASGRYRLSAEVTHLDSHEHHHGAGLVFGGADLDGPAQRYTYFLVHGGGRLLIKRRDGDQTTEIAPWILHPAVAKDDTAGVARNELAVDIGETDTGFLVNGTEVYRAPNADLHTEGLYGFRIVHNLDVRFTGLRVQPGR